MSNPWEMDWTGAQQGGPVYGPPPVVDPMDQQRMANDTARLQITQDNAALNREKFDYQRAQDGQDDGARAQADERAMSQLTRMIGKMGKIALDANDNNGWLETGTSGSMARAVLPAGTAGRDLNADIETLRANFAFDALQAMRDASKTGGALGQVTERELALLESSVANINPDQSHDQFLSNIENARQAYLAKLAMINPQLATRMGYNAETAEAALMAINDAYNREFGLTDGVTIDRSADPAAPQSTPADIDAIMRKYGVQQ